jgi:signal peptidase II
LTWRPAFWLVALAVIVIDQATKQWALMALQPGERVNLLGDYLQLQLVFNSGAAFSLGDNFTWVLTIVAVVVTVGLIYYSRRAHSTAVAWLFGIGLGGAVGNLVDRLFRDPSFGQGHVVDMINYSNQFVGNVADIAIVGAAIVAVVMGLRGKPLLRPARANAADSDPDEVSTG